MLLNLMTVKLLSPFGIHMHASQWNGKWCSAIYRAIAVVFPQVSCCDVEDATWFKLVVEGFRWLHEILVRILWFISCSVCFICIYHRTLKNWFPSIEGVMWRGCAVGEDEVEGDRSFFVKNSSSHCSVELWFFGGCILKSCNML